MKKLIFIIFLLPLFTVQAHAEDISREFIDDIGISEIEDSLSDEEQNISGELRLDGSYDGKGAVLRLFEDLKEKLKDSLKNELNFVSSILAVIFFCALASSLCVGGVIPQYIETVGCCAAALMLSGSVEGIISQAVSAVSRLSDYSRAALPILFTASAACGAVSSSGVKYAAACFAMEIFMSAARGLIVPLINAYLAVSLSSSVFECPMLKSASKLCKSLAVYLMTGIAILFSSYIALSGLIAGSSDILAVKATKTIISNSLPIVGGIISDSASVVLASASLIKNSAGIFCLVAVCAMCASPFAVLLLKSFLYKAVACAAQMLPGKRLSELLDSLGTAMSLLLGLVGSCGIMLFISIMSAIKVISI